MTTVDDQSQFIGGSQGDHLSLHVFFVVDCSGSMQGDKIASLNYAMRSALPALRAAAAVHPTITTYARVIRFSDEAVWVNEANDSVDRFEWRDLSADGETSLGAALETLASVLTADAMPGPQLPPVIVLLSDGLPTDDVTAGLALLKAAAHGSKAIHVAVAIGSDAHMPSLTEFMGDSSLRPLCANNAETLVNCIRWAASQPIAAVSRIAGSDQVTLANVTETLRSGTVQTAGSDGNFVW